jgi:hypothetical protein
MWLVLEGDIFELDLPNQLLVPSKYFFALLCFLNLLLGLQLDEVQNSHACLFSSLDVSDEVEVVAP